MSDTYFLFNQNWKIASILFLVIALSFLDKIIPPFGIPLALLTIFLLLFWKKLPVKTIGLYKPESWVKVLFIGLMVALFITAFDLYIKTPFLEWIGISNNDLALYESIEGNNSLLLIYLGVSWTTAGLGEELVYRGFFLGQFISSSRDPNING